MTVKRYRKKPVVIEAMQLKATTSHREVRDFCHYAGIGITLDRVNAQFDRNIVEVSIPTLEGVMKANLDDWIIKGVKGEFYPCKPDVFELTYEEVG